MEIYGYRRCYFCTILTWVAILATAFILKLILFWKPQWQLYMTYKRCPLDKAQTVLLVDKYGQYFVEDIKVSYGALDPASFINKATHHEPEEDDILRSVDSNEIKYGEQTYGSIVNNQAQRGARHRTTSGRSNKSVLTESGEYADYDENKLGESISDNEGDDLDNELAAPSPLPGAKQIEGDGDVGHVMVRFHDFDKDLSVAKHELRYFENKKIRYIWDETEKHFVRLRGYDRNVTFSNLQTMTNGLQKHEQKQRQRLFGENAIHVEVQSFLNILFTEVRGPFYIFQVFSSIIWFNDNYEYYATCIILMSLFSLITGTIQIRKNQEQLRDTVESEGLVKVCRGGDQYENIKSSQLVPGDVVVVPTFNTVLQFDGILINGNVIVNESMLTGESVPVTKTPLPLQNAKTRNKDVYYDEKEHSKHTLFCGTTIMQTRYYGGVYVKAIVMRVGYQTTKGELIRSIKFPKPVDFRFNKQIHKFIGVLACISLLGMCYSIGIKLYRRRPPKEVFMKAIDLITIVVPPALPAAMTIGIIYAQSRLKKSKIFCISPRSINISGCVNCVCFDKTGTLTEDNLSFHEVIPLLGNKSEFGKPFDEQVLSSKSRKVEREHNLLSENGEFSPLMICLASCHSLTIIEQKLVGDPLDLQMFEKTGWILEEPDVDDENKFDLLAPTVVRPPRSKRLTPDTSDNYQSSDDFSSTDSSGDDGVDMMANANKRCRKDVGILRQFPFSSNLQRMSVITRRFTGNQYVVYSKGAPEKIASLCDQSTIPEDFADVLHRYTRKGYRVLALAYRPLKSGLSYARMQRANRTEIERDLRFLGLLTLGNLLKPETVPAIETLNRADIRSVMVTGDNMLTAFSVANQCGMIGPNDKTVLLQAEKNNTMKGTNSSSSPASSSNNLAEQEQARATSELPTEPRPLSDLTSLEAPPPDVILNAASVEQEVAEAPNKAESLPILTPKKTRKDIKPKLLWSNIVHEQEDGPTENKPQPLQQPDRVSLQMFAREPKTHIALTGDTWATIIRYYPEMLNSICLKATVFARMSPHQKQQLVEQLQSLGYYVGMCGDGANDSGALRAAHTGISLSDTEASVAAPFTSANANISCIPILIAEGRAALVTAFGILKYMSLYSLTQFCSVLILYTMYTNFTDMEFLYEDLFIIAVLVTVFGRTGPCESLDKKAPSSSLLSIEQLASVAIQIVLMIAFQIMALLMLWQHAWYEPYEQVEEGSLWCHDNITIFAISSMQCISLALVFSKGKPYRKSVWSNKMLTAALVILSLTTCALIMTVGTFQMTFISPELVTIPVEFRCAVIALGATHFAVAMLAERYLVDKLIFRESDKFLEFLGFKPKATRGQIQTSSIVRAFGAGGSSLSSG